MYSRTEVLDAVGSVMTKFKDNSIRVIVPAGLMLLGGILLDVSGRRPGRRNLKKESDELSRRDS
jgi:invasion protein IalB